MDVLIKIIEVVIRRFVVCNFDWDRVIVIDLFGRKFCDIILFYL